MVDRVESGRSRTQPLTGRAGGQETGTPVLDMETRTKNWLMMLGPTASVAYFAMDDNTHLNMMGAVAVAKLAVAGIRDLGLPLAARALP